MLSLRKSAIAGAALSLATIAIVKPVHAQDRETGLGGVQLGTQIENIVSRFGNPNQVIVGEAGWRMPNGQATPLAATPAGGALGSEGSGSTAPYPVSPGSSGPFGSPFGSFPGASGSTGMPTGESGSGAPVGPPPKIQELTLVYGATRNTNLSYEYLIGSNGTVIQIKAIGYGDKGNVRTSRGVSLGSTYAQVLRTYGFPEENAQAGPITIATYRRRGVAFQFLKRGNETRVISITVASQS